MQRKRGWIIVMVLLLLSGCSLPGGSGVDETKQQLPDLSANYTQYEGEDLWETMENAGSVGALFSGNLQFAAVAGVIDTVGSCAQEKQIANWRVYVNKNDQFAAGVVVVVSHKNATNPALIADCALFGRPDTSGGLSPCSNTLEYATDKDTYTVLYAASKQAVCSDFQASFPAAQ